MKAKNLKGLFSKLSNYGDDALRMASNYGDDALDYGLDITKYTRDVNDIAEGFGNPNAFVKDVSLNSTPGKNVTIDLTPGRVPPPIKEDYLPEVSAYLDNMYDNISTKNNLYGKRFSNISPSQLYTYLDSSDYDPLRDLYALDDMYADTLSAIETYDKAADSLYIPMFDPESYRRLQDLRRILEDYAL